MSKYFKTPLLLIIIISTITRCTVIKTVKLVNSGELVYGVNTPSATPFEMKGHAIFIKARLNNSQKNYNLIFDTGALTALSQQTAKELKLPDGIEVEGRDTGGKAETVPLIKLDNIAVDNAKVKDCAAVVIDLSKEFGPDIDGILGSNFFRHFKVIIDYQKKEIIFSHDTKQIAVKDNEISIPFEIDMKNGFAPKIECIIDDEIKGTGIIDTGSPAIADIPLPVMKKTKSFQEGSVITSNGNISGGIFGMSEKSYLLRLDKLKAGGLELAYIPSMSHSSKGQDILFGSGFLSKFKVTLNYPAGEMVLEPNGIAFETNIFSYGLALAKKEMKTVVSGIWQNSSADRNLVKPGDEIVMVNSKNPNELSLFELMTLFNDEKSDIIEVEFINDKGKHNVKLHKEMLLPAL